jgi:integrase
MALINSLADGLSIESEDVVDAELLPVGTLVPAAREAQIVADVSAWTGADYHLTERTREKLRAATPAATLRAYERWWRQVADWCVAEGRVALPMTAESLTEWVRTLTDTVSARTGKPLGVSSLDQAVAAVRAVHTEAGFDGMPGTRGARLLIKAHGRQLAEAGRTERKSAVVTADQALDVAQRCDPGTLAGARDRLLVALSFAAWTRRSELARLNLSDVRPSTDPGRPGLYVAFRTSKTDQAGKGAEIFLPARGDALCPLLAWQAWRSLLAEQGVSDGRLLRKVDRWGNLGEQLAPGGVNDISKRLVQDAGYGTDERGRSFTAHGWRASGRSAAVDAGASEEAANEHGRWSRNSRAGKGYERDRGALADHPMSKVAARQAEG